MTSITFCLFLSSLCLTIVTVSSAGLKEEFTWTRLEYNWPQEGLLASRFSMYRRPIRPLVASPNRGFVFQGATNADLVESNKNINITDAAQPSINSGSVDYQYVNNVPMAANVWKNKLFISVPRRRLGIPSTLNYVPLDSPNRHDVPLTPYPNWDINLYPDTSGTGDNFVSVYRVAIDPCDRMWLVDTGVIETLGNRQTIKPHQLVIIDLLTDKIIHRFTMPESVVTPKTTLASVTVDVTKDTCDKAFAYFPDLAGFGLTVFSLQERRFWRVNHNYFFVEPTAGDFNIAGFNFQWNDGVFSVELSDIKGDGYRDMYFHSMAGTNMYRVSTRVIRNETLATRDFHGDDFQIVGNRGPLSQTSQADLHKPSGIMFLSMVNQNAVGCWNTNKPLNTLSIVQKDNQRMIYPSDLKIVGDKLYVLTNTMPRFIYGELDYNQINFRVWSNDVRSAISGTRCQ